MLYEHTSQYQACQPDRINEEVNEEDRSPPTQTVGVLRTHKSLPGLPTRQDQKPSDSPIKFNIHTHKKFFYMIVFKQIELTNLDTRSKAVGVSKPALTTETVGQVIATPQQKQKSPQENEEL